MFLIYTAFEAYWENGQFDGRLQQNLEKIDYFRIGRKLAKRPARLIRSHTDHPKLL